MKTGKMNEKIVRNFISGLMIFFCASLNAQSIFPFAVADGYAKGTTGGAGGTTVTVSSASAFKSACESSATMIIIVDGNLGNIGQVSLKSNKTIIGKNSSAGYTGNLSLSGVSNIIVQNLNIANPSGVGTADGMEASSGCTKIFVTKCTFSDCADGSFDIKRGSDNVTVSWCRFRYPTISGHNFPNLIGHSDDNGSQDRGKLHVTMHHNWYDKGCQDRMPRVRFGTVHVYNNYYGYASGYAIGTGVESSIRVESCVFDNIKKPWNDMNGKANGAKIGWSDLSMINGSSTPSYISNSWPVFTPSYSFSKDNVNDVKNLVTNATCGAGNVGSCTTTPPPPPTTYVLSTTVVGQGTVSPANGSFSSGTVVTLTATPAAGYQFSGWSGALSGTSNPASLTMSANKAITATFTQIVVNNVKPTVSISSPTNGASFTAPASILIAANAADSDGSVTKVEFYNGSTLLGSDATSPYSFTWNNVAAGSYIYYHCKSNG